MSDRIDVPVVVTPVTNLVPGVIERRGFNETFFPVGPGTIGVNYEVVEHFDDGSGELTGKVYMVRVEAISGDDPLMIAEPFGSLFRMAPADAEQLAQYLVAWAGYVRSMQVSQVEGPKPKGDSQGG